MVCFVDDVVVTDFGQELELESSIITCTPISSLICSFIDNSTIRWSTARELSIKRWIKR